MSEAPTKAELLARLKQERATWEGAFGALTREQLLLPDAIGSWSTKDLQDHIISNNRWLAVQLRALVRGTLPTAEDTYGHEQTPPTGTDLADQEQRNAWWYTVDRARPLDETLVAAPLWAAALGGDRRRAGRGVGTRLHVRRSSAHRPGAARRRRGTGVVVGEHHRLGCR